MALKRSRDSFEEDLNQQRQSGSGLLEYNAAPMDGTMQPFADVQALRLTDEAATKNLESTTQDGWVTHQSKASRKKQKNIAKWEERLRVSNLRNETQHHNDSTSWSSLRFPSKITSPLAVRDLQALILYTLSDGVAPNWVAVRDAKKFQQVVVLMVPGLDKALLEQFISKIPEDDGNGTDDSTVETHTASSTASEVHTSEVDKPSGSEMREFLIPVRAPGESRSGRVHSTLQAILTCPEQKDNKSSRSSGDSGFQPSKTRLASFIHTADDLQVAQYPIHPALFTNQEDALLEQTRRQGVGQTAVGGWVGSKVSTNEPERARQTEVKMDYFTNGLNAYAIDCEMVVTTDDVYSLARISVLNWDGDVVMDEFVLPDLPVKEYHTAFSGITPEILAGITTSLKDVQRKLLDICTSSTVLMGHSLESDLCALKMTHPFIVDTALIYPHARGLPLRNGLKYLANRFLKREIQKGGSNGHDSVEDARAVLDLVKLKCKMGPSFGTFAANGESIFARLTRSGRPSAIVEYGTPERGLGQLASLHVGCSTDEEITSGVIATMGRSKKANPEVSFIFGRYHDLNNARGWNDLRSKHEVQTGDAADAVAEDIATKDKVNNATNSTVGGLLRIFQALREKNMMIILPEVNDMAEVIRLQNLHKQYQKEFKVKKWDDLSVQWTDREAEALRSATDKARNGWAFVYGK